MTVACGNKLQRKIFTFAFALSSCHVTVGLSVGLSATGLRGASSFLVQRGSQSSPDLSHLVRQRPLYRGGSGNEEVQLHRCAAVFVTV